MIYPCSWKTKSMKHTEGGWPQEVKPPEEHKNKFLRKIMKEEMFIFTLSKLIIKVERVLKENSTLAVEEQYFDNEDTEDDNIVEKHKLSTLTKFRDNSRDSRSVSCFSWKHSGVTDILPFDEGKSRIDYYFCLE